MILQISNTPLPTVTAALPMFLTPATGCNDNVSTKTFEILSPNCSSPLPVTFTIEPAERPVTPMILAEPLKGIPKSLATKLGFFKTSALACDMFFGKQMH